MFYPDIDDKAPDYRLAKSICARCPVKPECLVYGMSGEHGAWGVWGGTTPNERRKIRRLKRFGDTLALAGQEVLDIE